MPNATDVAPPAPRKAPGDRIGSYYVLGVLGAGPTGVVYRARDQRLKRDLAIKVLPAADAGGRERLLRDAQAMARVSHPNLVTVYEAGVVDDDVFVAMELVAGTSLRAQPLRAQALRGRRWREVVALYAAAGRGLAAAHAAGVVHRDFKPDNLLVVEDGDDDDRVRVADFGLGGGGASTGAYMAPEQRAGGPASARADQFAFCVALWEGLHGTRPEETPKDTGDVPGWLRAVLLRGLRPAPEERFPTMDALLAALANDPAVRRRRALAAVGLAALAGAGAFGFLRDTSHDQACTGAERKLAGKWDDGVKRAVHAKLLATGRPYAEDTSRRVSAELDRYSADWVGMHKAACKEKALLDLRMQCLDRRAGELGALTALLSAAPDRAVLDRSVQAAHNLPDLRGCADTAALTAVVPGPSDDATRIAVASVRARLAAVQAEHAVGHYREAQTHAVVLAAEARGIPYPALRAEVLYVLGYVEEEVGHFIAAEAAVREGLWAAAAAKDDMLAFHMWRRLVWGLADRSRIDEAVATLPAATAALARAGDDPRRRAVLELTMGRLGVVQGDLAKALAHYRRGVALQEAGGEEPLTLANSLAGLASVLHRAGRLFEAQVVQARALDIRERILGPDHPAVAASLNNRCNVLLAAGHPAEAREACERALAIFERALGPDYYESAATLTNLGLALERMGRLTDARAAYRRALAIKEKSYGPEHVQVARTLQALSTLAAVEGSYDEARRGDERALAIFEKALGPDHHETALLVNNLGLEWHELGDDARARAYLVRALAALEKGLGPDHPDVANALRSLAQVDVTEGRLADATARIRRALAIDEKELGPKDSVVGEDFNQMGDILDAQKRYPEARIEHARAVAIFEGIEDVEPRALGIALTGVGTSLLGEGRPADAVPPLERAFAIYAPLEVAPVDKAATSFALARALWASGGDRARAVVLAREARDGLAAKGLRPDRGEQITAWLAARTRR